VSQGCNLQLKTVAILVVRWRRGGCVHMHIYTGMLYITGIRRLPVLYLAVAITSTCTPGLFSSGFGQKFGFANFHAF